MPELPFFLKMKHDTFRHIVGNIKDTVKIKNFVDTNYLTAV